MPQPNQAELYEMLTRIEARLDGLDQKIDAIAATRNKPLEWIGQLAEHIRSLDEFREEVRATFEPLMGKLSGMDEVVRILRHATSDVSRQVEDLERRLRDAG